ncbi:MAG: hypothetical protein JWN31_764 [Frankiales bacterium]|nr:hypothetical protein [Frankiales bacterium]
MLYPSVYADGFRTLSAEDWALAATLASAARHPGAVPPVASGRTAARVWGMPLIDDNDPATRAHNWFMDEVITTRALPDLTMAAAPDEPRGRELRRRQRRLAPSQVVRHASGFWITNPVTTAIDLVPALALDAALCLLDDGLHRGLFTAAELASATSGRPGSRAMARALALADGRAESPPETLARLLLRPLLPGLVPQVRCFDYKGVVVARFDLGDPDVKLAVEVDGKLAHAGDRMVAKDRARDRRTEALGWVTERCTWYELRRQPQELVARIVARDAQLRRGAA